MLRGGPVRLLPRGRVGSAPGRILPVASRLEIQRMRSHPSLSLVALAAFVTSAASFAQVPGYLGVDAGDTAAGASVRQAVPGGPAERAGLQGGDIITAINDQAVNQSFPLGRAIG